MIVEQRTSAPLLRSEVILSYEFCDIQRYALFRLYVPIYIEYLVYNEPYFQLTRRKIMLADYHPHVHFKIRKINTYMHTYTVSSPMLIRRIIFLLVCRN